MNSETEFFNLRERLYSLIDFTKPVAVVTDRTISEIYGERLRGAVPELRDVPFIVVEPGKKDLDSLAEVWRGLSDCGMTRGGVVINIGGGTVTDLGGFAAATFKRGVATINVPTTLLAMADASIGGKTGIDFNGLKNEVGAFALPKAVVIDTTFLESLPPVEILSGFAEMLKTGLIADNQLYCNLLKIGSPVGVPSSVLTPLVERTVEIKMEIVDRDPQEKGLRKILNFGHTVGHAFESRAAAVGDPVPHGVAIARGLLTELILSHNEAGLDSEALYPLARLLREVYPQFPFACGQYEPLLELMAHDKKNSGDGLLNFTLVPEIGRSTYDNLIAPEKVRGALDMTLDLLGL